MKHIDRISLITQKIIELERHLKLFEWKIKDIYIWELLRHKIYLQIIGSNEERNNFEIKVQHSGERHKWKNYSKFIYLVVSNPYFVFRRKDILIFESSRIGTLMGTRLDPYTFNLEDFFDPCSRISRYQTVYVKDFSFQSWKKRKDVHSIVIFEYLCKIFNLFNRTKFYYRNCDEELISNISRTIKTELYTDINLKKLIEEEISNFLKRRSLFRILLSMTQPKEIYLVNFSDKMSLIDVARDRKIKVTDIQHGLISSEDLIYHYPHSSNLKYFPDRMYIWDDMWSKICTIPVKSSNIIVKGNAFLDGKVREYANVERKLNKILIVSQPGLTIEIAKEILSFINLWSKFEIVYKLHPLEKGYEELYEPLISLMKEHKVEMINNSVDVYKLMAESLYVVGVYSTALFEAILFKCQVRLLNLPGSEMMMPFVIDRKVEFLNKNEFQNSGYVK